MQRKTKTGIRRGGAVANAHERLSAMERKLLRMQAEMNVRDVLDKGQRERFDAMYGSGQQQ